MTAYSLTKHQFYKSNVISSVGYISNIHTLKQSLSLTSHKKQKIKKQSKCYNTKILAYVTSANDINGGARKIFYEVEDDGYPESPQSTGIMPIFSYLMKLALSDNKLIISFSIVMTCLIISRISSINFLVL